MLYKYVQVEHCSYRKTYLHHVLVRDKLAPKCLRFYIVLSDQLVGIFSHTSLYKNCVRNILLTNTFTDISKIYQNTWNQNKHLPLQ